MLISKNITLKFLHPNPQVLALQFSTMARAKFESIGGSVVSHLFYCFRHE